jgi:hypothetical protein
MLRNGKAKSHLKGNDNMSQNTTMTRGAVKFISGFQIDASHYMPVRVKRLIERINAEKNISAVALYGFGDDMKWLYRVLREHGHAPTLFDWRKNFIGYDCGGAKVCDATELSKLSKETLVVACCDQIKDLKASMRFLIEKKINSVPVIYEHEEIHDPFHQDEPYRTIATKARARAKSMLHDQQLFDLIQLVKATKDVEGSILEFGSLHGGSGAVLVEAANHYGKKPVYLFDSFDGIPDSRYGLDYRWSGAFSNNSYQEVKNAFKDCDNVKVVQGNLCETYKTIEGPVSICYVASDTLESGEILLNHFWPRLSENGIMLVCDYGSYPNCLPLTVMCDMFVEDKPDAFVFKTAGSGIFIVKRSKQR